MAGYNTVRLPTATLRNSTGDGYAGGVAGYNAGEITSSSATGGITGIGASSNTGGVAGYNAGEINNSYATGDIIAPATPGAWQVQFRRQYPYSYANGRRYRQRCQQQHRGVAGYIPAAVSITATLRRYYRERYLQLYRGVTGYNSGEISNSYAEGTVIGSKNAGGVTGTIPARSAIATPWASYRYQLYRRCAGTNSGEITNSYATGGLQALVMTAPPGV